MKEFSARVLMTFQSGRWSPPPPRDTVMGQNEVGFPGNNDFRGNRSYLIRLNSHNTGIPNANT